MNALFNGQPPDGSLATARGLHYGDGVFRTLLVWQGQVLDWPQQLEKLQDDCARLELAMPAAAQLQSELQTLTQGKETLAAKIIVMRKPAQRGYAPHTAEADRLLICNAAPRYPARYWEEGISALRSTVQLGSQPRLAGIKHLNRLEQVLASRDWPEGIAESLMCNEAGEPLCGTRSNLFWVSGGVLHTPALDRCGVAGLMRAKLLALAATLGLPSQVQTQDWSALKRADEAFISNSLIGLWPLRQVEQQRWNTPGPVTQKLMTALQHPRLTT